MDDKRKVAFAYCALLQVSHDAWRAQNQALYCALREAVAKLDGRTEQETQDRYEYMAARHPF